SALAAIVLVAALGEHREGAAIVLALAALAPPLLLPRSGLSWPVCVGAPVLGFAGLAGAWPAIAARAGSFRRRAALGAIGWLWLVLAAPIAGRDLYVRRPAGTPPP